MIKYHNTVSSDSVFNIIESVSYLENLDKKILLPKKEFFNVFEERVNERILIDLWLSLDKHNRDFSYALIIGREVINSSKGFLISLMYQCETVLDAIECYVKYLDWMSPSEKIELVKNNNFIDVVFSVDKKKGYTESIIIKSMAFITTFINLVSNNNKSVSIVNLEIDKPKNCNLFEEILSEKILFSQNKNILRIGYSSLRVKIISNNIYLKKYLERNINLLKKSYIEKSSHTISKKSIFEITDELLSSNKANIETVSDYFSVSRQTLHKVLKKENTSFKMILNEVRKEKSIYLLIDKDLKTLQISKLLGYKEVSSFYNAFKKWHGLTVSEYKQINLNLC